MSEFCKKKKIKHILLGHHLDDQIENFYIRLSRGSGLTGLSPIKTISKYKKVCSFTTFFKLKKKSINQNFKKIF